LRAHVLGFPVDSVSVPEAVDRVATTIRDSGTLQVVTVNAEMAMQGLADPEFGSILKDSGLVLPDGSGVVWAVKRQGKPVTKLAGVDFVGHIAQWCAREGKSLFLFGAAEGIADAAAAKLQERYPGLRIAGTRSGFFTPDEEPAVLEQIRTASPDVLFVALGVPRQEKWIAKHQKALGVPVAMGVGGSFDVLADRVKRAPVGFQRLHLEWLYRLIQEPWRWKRMSSTLPRFAWLVMWQK